jgi:hypothetical protein
MKHVALLSLPVLAAACALLTEGRAKLPPAELPVEMHRLSLVAAPTSLFSVEGAENAVIVRDLAVTGVCHRHENHGAYLDGDEIVLWIAHTGSLRGDCPSVGTFRPYEAVISGLDPGDHRFRVDYIGQIDTFGHPRPGLSASVTVH